MNNKIFVYVGIALLVGAVVGYTVNQSRQVRNYQKGNAMADASGNNNGKRNGTNQDQNRQQNGKEQNNSQPNRNNCLGDDCLMVNDLEYPAGTLSQQAINALNEAINDEYKALSTYEAVIEKFGQVRPFSMIKGAEEQHIASLKAIFDKYGLEVPQNSWSNNISAPETLQIACQTGVDAEIANASLYKDKLLPAVKDYQEITTVFTNLMNASLSKHLPAFDRCN